MPRRKKDWSTHEIIKNIYGDSFYLYEEKHLQKFNLTLSYGRPVLGVQNITGLILTSAVKTFILSTMDQPLRFAEPFISRCKIQRLRKECQNNPYSTYQKWIEHGCKPTYVTFNALGDNPQFINDYYNEKYVLYSAKQIPSGLILFQGCHESNMHDPVSCTSELILTSEIAEAMMSLDYRQSFKHKALKMPLSSYRSLMEKLALNMDDIRNDYIAKHAHTFLSATAKSLYPRFQQDGIVYQTSIRDFQSRTRYIIDRMPEQVSQDLRFFTLLQQAASEPTLENTTSFLNYHNDNDYSGSILITTMNILQKSGLLSRFEAMIVDKDPRIKWAFPTADKSTCIDDLFGVYYVVTKCQSDPCLKIPLHYGYKVDDRSNHTRLILTKVLADKIRETLNQPAEFFTDSLIGNKHYSQLRREALSNPFATLNCWMNAKNRTKMVRFHDARQNPQYVHDYRGIQHVVYQAECLGEGFFLFQGIPTTELSVKKSPKAAILTQEIFNLLTQYRYNPQELYKHTPLPKYHAEQLREKLGFQLHRDLRQLYAENIEFILGTSSDPSVVVKKFPFTTQRQIQSYRKKCQLIEEILCHQSRNNRILITALENFYQTQSKQARLTVDRLFNRKSTQQIRFIYDVMRRADRIPLELIAKKAKRKQEFNTDKITFLHQPSPPRRNHQGLI